MKNSDHFRKALMIAGLVIAAITINAQPLTADIKVNGTPMSSFNICIGDYQSLDGAPSGGSQVYTSHQWTSQNGQIAPTNGQLTTFTASVAGVDTVVYSVADNLGATASDTVIINVFQNPLLYYPLDQTICPGTCVDLTFFSPNTVNLEVHDGPLATDPIIGNVISPTITVNVCPAVTTDYLCVAYDTATNCYRSKTVRITVSPNPVVTVSPSSQAVCAGTQVTLTATGGVTYNWSSGVVNGVPFVPVITTIYTVTASDNVGCTATANVTVTVNSLAPASLAISANPSGPIAPGTSVTFTATSTNGGTVPTYQWKLNGVNLSGETNITYISSTLVNGDVISCVMTSNAVCATGNPATSNLITMLVTSNSIATSITHSDISCFGGSNGSADLTVIGGISPYTYAWSNSANTEDLTNIPAGTYTVTVTDMGGNSATNSVTINQPSAPVTVTFTGTNVLCYGDSSGSVILTISGGTPGQGGYTIPWGYPLVIGYNANVPAGTYTLSTSDGAGCTASGSITITQPTPLSDTISKTNATCSSCSDGSAIATASGGTAPYSYYWNNGVTTANVTGLAPGIYHITITDVNGCTATDSVVISFGNCLATFSIYPDTALQHHYFVVNNATGTAPVQYIWSWGDGSPNDTAAYPSHTYATSGYYDIYLYITDAAGCTDTYCNNFYLQKNLNDIISVDVIAPLVGINEYAEENNISVYPNPSKELLTVKIQNSKARQYCIYNSFGQLISSGETKSEETKINVSKLSKGLYLLKVESADKIIMKKFIKE